MSGNASCFDESDLGVIRTGSRICDHRVSCLLGSPDRRYHSKCRR